MYTVYRVEHLLTEKGPYDDRFRDIDPVLTQMHEEHNLRVPAILVDTHPGVWRDVEGFNHLQDSCGFESMESLKEWFGEYLDHLLKAGFVIKQYEVESYKKGQFQIAFKKNHTERIFDIIEASLKEL